MFSSSKKDNVMIFNWFQNCEGQTTDVFASRIVDSV
jgi:hypothetical protein